MESGRAEAVTTIRYLGWQGTQRAGGKADYRIAFERFQRRGSRRRMRFAVCHLIVTRGIRRDFEARASQSRPRKRPLP